MKTINDGGQAFPIAVDEHDYECGMTLRDYFAAKAMAAIIDSTAGMMRVERAAAAYKWADAMIAERDKGQP